MCYFFFCQIPPPFGNHLYSLFFNCFSHYSICVSHTFAVSHAEGRGYLFPIAPAFIHLALLSSREATCSLARYRNLFRVRKVLLLRSGRLSLWGLRASALSFNGFPVSPTLVAVAWCLHVRVYFCLFASRCFWFFFCFFFSLRDFVLFPGASVYLYVAVFLLLLR